MPEREPRYFLCSGCGWVGTQDEKAVIVDEDEPYFLIYVCPVCEEEL